MRDIILAYTNNALSLQYRPPSAEATFFGTEFHHLQWAAVSKTFLKKVFSGFDDDDANDACFTCGCRKRELRWMYLGVLQLQLHRSGVLTLSRSEEPFSPARNEGMAANLPPLLQHTVGPAAEPSTAMGMGPGLAFQLKSSRMEAYISDLVLRLGANEMAAVINKLQAAVCSADSVADINFVASPFLHCLR